MMGVRFSPPEPTCTLRLERPRTPPFHGGDTGSNPVGCTNPSRCGRASRQRSAKPPRQVRLLPPSPLRGQSVYGYTAVFQTTIDRFESHCPLQSGSIVYRLVRRLVTAEGGVRFPLRPPTPVEKLAKLSLSKGEAF